MTVLNVGDKVSFPFFGATRTTVLTPDNVDAFRTYANLGADVTVVESALVHRIATLRRYGCRPFDAHLQAHCEALLDG